MLPLRYSSFTKQFTVIKNRLSTLATQVATLVTNETTLSKSDKSKIQIIDDEVVKKYEDFSGLLERLFNSDTIEDSDKDSLDVDEISKCQEEISNLYIQIHSQCASLIVTESSKLDCSTSHSSSTSCSNENSYVRLPTLNLGVFSGQPEKWIAFHSLFESTVHTNNKLSQVEKFTYLLSCLTNEPLNIIKSLPITAENYTIAYDQLVKRYNNTRLLISLHINKIMDLTSMNHSSVKQLRHFLSIFQENSSALHALGYDLTKESIFITSFLLRKFDHDFRSKFERSREDCTEMPTLTELIEFIETECIQLEAANLTQSSSQSQTFQPKSKFGQFHAKVPNNTKTALIASNQSCNFCNNNDHSIYKCDKFKQLSIEERVKFAKENSICNNCLGKHNVRNCRSNHSCQVCHRRHHSLLHLGNQSSSHSDAKPSSTSAQSSKDHRGQSQSENNQTTLFCSQSDSQLSNQTISNIDAQPNSTLPSALVGLSKTKDNVILLGTALVQVQTHSGNSLTVRAVLDSAAQQCFISASCARKLRVSNSKSTGQILGISSAFVPTKGSCELNIATMNGNIIASNHHVTILENITTHLPICRTSNNVKTRTKHLILADPDFDTPAPIDLLIGADLFADTLTGETVSLGLNMPTALNTIFGYVLIGSAPVQESSTNCSVNLLSVTNLDLHNAVQKFWSEENVPETSKLSPEEKLCESHFLETHKRCEDGKYQVRLPFKTPPNDLGDSDKHALCFFKSLENRLNQNPTIKKKYEDFMVDYENAGHMVSLPSPIPPQTKHCFLPHHFVMRDEKIRVVFNASSKTSTGASLNSMLHAGPKLHTFIPNVLFGFRRHKFVFTCDIQQMFRNIWVHPEDQLYQLIYWRNDSSQPLKIFQLKTVTYGMAPSPFLANRVIQQLINDEAAHHPLAAAALKGQIYVDDALLGSDSLEQCLLLQEDTIKLMGKGGFALRKWTSNNREILNAVPAADHGVPLQFVSTEQSSCNVLGIKWLPDQDAFTYTVSVPTLPTTKRSVLSTIARLYDPLGWITPVVFYAKSFLQIMWTKGLQWDDPLPSELSSSWESFSQQLQLLEGISIPRHVDTIACTDLQLHGFSDASEAGYCAVVFLRVQKSNGIQTHLLTSKSRVAPLKKVSLPRLELCGAHLLSKLLHYCVTELSHLTLDRVYAWCDSTVTLSWILTPAYRLKTYVANRVAEIQDTKTPINWLHVSSAQNPADCGSRGLMPSALISHHLWWTGPEWLKNSPLQIPLREFDSLPLESLPEVKAACPAALHVTENSATSDLLTRFSSWTKLIHVIAYIKRFIQNSKPNMSIKGNETKTPYLEKKVCKNTQPSFQELDQATKQVLRLVQQESFQKEISILLEKKPLTTSLKRLSPFLDEEGLLRIGGRLSNSSLRYNAKHPILLPKRHFITNMIIDHYHRQYLHCGAHQLQTLLVQKYWILSARSAIRSRIFKCISCYRSKPTFNPPKMADLPGPRVSPTKPFLTSAVDFAGPFSVKLHNLRRLQHVKIYLCLFICLSTKAVHLEVAMDLTAECFIGCLTRFISRRGQITNLHSDNGTNFTGAARKIRETVEILTKESPTKNYLERENITFHFIPPRAPHFGGLWERAVQSAKKHMRRVIGDQVLTIEEFTTLVCRVEAMLNSRPLTPMSSDPSDLDVLTPGHFLTGGPLVSLPEIDQTNTPMNRLRRWRLLQSFAQHIWKRWHREYLHTLQNRPKWTNSQKNFEIGDLVLVHEDNVSPLQWKRGRVTKVIPGRDQVVRVVEVKTASGLFTRPTVKLSPLPVE